jgi:hypothetical protein
MAPDGVLVVLGDARGDRRSIDDLVRRGNAKVVRLAKGPPARAGALREQRFRIIGALAPGQVRAGSPALLPLASLPATALRPRLRRPWYASN